MHEDTTGGLNRDGRRSSLLIPIEHQLLTLGNTRRLLAAGAAARARQPGQPTYQASPRVRRIAVATLGGTVGAEHAENVPAETIGRSDGRPGQSFRCRTAPVLPRREGETVIVRRPRTARSTGPRSRTSPRPARTDRHYVWDSGTGIGPLRPACALPRRHRTPARRDPARRCADRRDRLPPRRRRARQRRRPHADRAALDGAVRRARDEPRRRPPAASTPRRSTRPSSAVR